eukprot:6173368-Pleurochrysis_carterae.AAC.3
MSPPYCATGFPGCTCMLDDKTTGSPASVLLNECQSVLRFLSRLVLASTMFIGSVWYASNLAVLPCLV